MPTKQPQFDYVRKWHCMLGYCHFFESDQWASLTQLYCDCLATLVPQLYNSLRQQYVCAVSEQWENVAVVVLAIGHEHSKSSCHGPPTLLHKTVRKMHSLCMFSSCEPYSHLQENECFQHRSLEYGVMKHCNVIGQCLDSKSHRILSCYLESKARIWISKECYHYTTLASIIITWILFT